MLQIIEDNNKPRIQVTSDRAFRLQNLNVPLFKNCQGLLFKHPKTRITFTKNKNEEEN